MILHILEWIITCGPIIVFDLFMMKNYCVSGCHCLKLKCAFDITHSLLQHLFSILNIVLGKNKTVRNSVETYSKIMNKYSCGNVI